MPSAMRPLPSPRGLLGLVGKSFPVSDRTYVNGPPQTDADSKLSPGVGARVGLPSQRNIAQIDRANSLVHYDYALLG